MRVDSKISHAFYTLQMQMVRLRFMEMNDRLDETSDRFQQEQLLYELIKSGTSIKEIKRRSRMTFSDIQDYFLKLVGQGRLLNSSIYFCWSDNERNLMQEFLDGKQTKAVIEDNDISEHEIALFSFLRDK